MSRDKSRAWTVYSANTIQKNSEDSMGGEFKRPLWVRWWAT